MSKAIRVEVQQPSESGEEIVYGLGVEMTLWPEENGDENMLMDGHGVMTGFLFISPLKLPCN